MPSNPASNRESALEITGHTQLVGILANPVAHVRTPQLLNASAARQGLDVCCVPMHVREPDLERCLAGALGLVNLAGLIVTIPHKEAVVVWCGELTDTANLIRSVNVMRLDHERRIWIGANFDGDGFIAGLASEGHFLEGRRVLLAGTGGAGKSMAYAIARSRPAALRVYNRSPQRAHDMVALLRQALPDIAVDAGDNDPAEFDVVVNATSLGLKEGDGFPVPVERLQAGTLVCEAVVRDGDTALLSAARERGCQVHHGQYMLYGQVVEMARFLGIALQPENVARILGPFRTL